MERIFIETHGCSANLSESEIMSGLLAKAGYEISDDIAKAGIVVVNSCTVKGEDTMMRGVRNMLELHPYKKLIIAGCLTKELIEGVRRMDRNASFINTHNIQKIVDAVEQAKEGNRVEILSRERKVKLSMPKIRKNPVVGIVPVLNGCNNHCSFCSVWMVKGQLMSYPADMVVEEVGACVKDGCREIWLTSQDNSAYGTDTGDSFPSLLRRVCDVEGDFMIRVGMMNPQHILPKIGEYIDAFKHQKVFKFLHLPVQSGNDEVLKNMDRGYTVGEFRKIIECFREEIPDITLSTDVICGFPGETEEQAKETEMLIEEIGFDIVNISRFSPRPNTRASRMNMLSGGLVKDRSRRMTFVCLKSAEKRNSRWLGWEGEILIDEAGKGGTMIGRNYAYKPVVVRGDCVIGRKARVKIKNSTPFDLRGEAI